tara:strand:- start:60290 stop:60781 length:492 start_codon:yes stop_codon:yes gene_type:complete
MTFKETIDKLFDRDNLANVLENERAKGKTIVFTNGCFDLLHPGHVHLLKTSRSFGDLLVVAINTDSSIRGIKDTGRPIFSEVERAYMLSSLSCVDHIVLFNESTPIPLLTLLRPDVLVKGDHYGSKEVVGWDLVEGYGGRIERIPILKGLSTTSMIERIMKTT